MGREAWPPPSDLDSWYPDSWDTFKSLGDWGLENSSSAGAIMAQAGVRIFFFPPTHTRDLIAAKVHDECANGHARWSKALDGARLDGA